MQNRAAIAANATQHEIVQKAAEQRRLEDKAALVRKSAMHLLSTMLQYNPFAPCLPVQKFEASLQEYQQKLEQAEQEKGPAGDEEGAEEVGEEGERRICRRAAERGEKGG